MKPSELRISYPGWVADFLDWKKPYVTDEEKVRLAIALARENVERRSGGPFGAAVFEASSGKLVSAGVNQVVPQNNSCLHAEVMAIMMAEARLKTHSLKDKSSYILAASCAPCALCLGATLWSGVARLVYGAAPEDARAIGFDEGPVFPESWKYLEKAGVTVVPSVLRTEAKAVLDFYKSIGGPIYNP